MKLKYRDYSQVRDNIREGDLVLKRGAGKPSPFVRYYSRSLHTHIMVASWHYGKRPDGTLTNGILEVVEFREGYGSRTTNLSEYVNSDDGLLDVFRPSSKVQVIDENNPDGYWKEYDPWLLTEQMRRATGKGYGWFTIPKMYLLQTPARIFMQYAYDDELEGNHNVCSTSLSYYLRKDYVDFVQYLADDYTRPGDFARSPLTHYMFTLTNG